jgi:hypothetical protein
MKRIQTIVACALALALVGVAALRSAEMGRTEGKAVVRAVHGSVEYEFNGAWMPLKPNKELDPGVKIRTGPDSYADLFVNGSSTVRIAEDTTMIIPEMFRVGPVRGADTETTLDLQNGTVLGNVKKLSANSRYEIKTPHGVAGVRGTDFEVTVKTEPNGGFVVTFTSVTGELIVSAIVGPPGTPPTVKLLRTGESWTPGQGEVMPTPPEIIAAARFIIDHFPPPGPIFFNVPPPPPPPQHVNPSGPPSSPSS